MGNGSNIKKWKIAKYAKLNFIKIVTIFGKVILIWKRVKFLQNRKMWEMAASYKHKILQKNHLISKQILNIEVHTCFISKHVSMCWFLNSSRFSVKLQMIFNLFPPPFLLKKSLPLRSDMLYGWPPTIVENCEQNCEQKCEQNCEPWTVRRSRCAKP